MRMWIQDIGYTVDMRMLEAGGLPTSRESVGQPVKRATFLTEPVHEE